uniref:Ecdysteroid kinase n=1 Tax=Musca domestica TaxID=7370 RepID=T1PB49_MUSDO
MSVDVHKSYIDKHLIPEILSKLDNEELVSYKTEHSSGLDGFMSALYNIQLKTKSKEGEIDRLLIAKFMRGDVEFRESSKSYVQFANEIFIYSDVLPQYEKLLNELKITTLKITELAPSCYKAAFGYIEGLSSSPKDEEAALVLENLKPMGYGMGPRLILDRDHLLAMCKPVAKHHAFSYALRALNNNQLERLKSGLNVLQFIPQSAEEAKGHLYTIIYRLGFDRFYEYFDRIIDTNTFDKKCAKDLKLIENLRRLKEKYFEQPTKLLEKLRVRVEETEEDRKFAAILHGDYNRNNVLFKYNAEGKVEDVKMIDFQEVRYGSPVLDLSFFMYFNSSAEGRYELWPVLLQTYHSYMYETLEMLLKASGKSQQEIEDVLSHYTFEKFQRHFARFAFYGVIICFHFLPWMLCSEEECSELSELFANDFTGERFRKLSIEAGGDEVNFQILAAVRHASEMGYMDDL